MIAVRRCAISTYCGPISMIVHSRLFSSATFRVVPLPPKGSRTCPPSGAPARMQGSINFSGNVAKCASANCAVATVQTDRLFRDPESFGMLPLLCLSTISELSKLWPRCTPPTEGLGVTFGSSPRLRRTECPL